MPRKAASHTRAGSCGSRTPLLLRRLPSLLLLSAAAA
jgi:hypothetical protein